MEGGVYLDNAATDIPPFEQTKSYALGELYLWQWDYWIREDILRGLTANNRPEGVFENPVKRIRRIAPEPIAAFQGGSGQPGPGAWAWVVVLLAEILWAEDLTRLTSLSPRIFRIP